MRKLLMITVFFLGSLQVSAQIDEDQTGAWYMYFFNAKFSESNIGFQGDIQYRNWNLGGDLEQLLLRGGLNYQPAGSDVRFTLGYGNITTGVMGEEKTTSSEHRIYQEVLLPHNPLPRVYLNHRFRYEQRFVVDQDLRTRYRYTLFMNIPLNKSSVKPGAVYLALYNELFINGQRSIGEDRQVEIFDRNRTYLGVGYSVLDNLKVQAGWMHQATDNWTKSQLQVSLHHRLF